MSTVAATSIQYHFVSKTASNFNVCVVLHLSFAIFSSLYDPDVSTAIAVMGIIAALNYSVGLLLLYLLFTPATFILDIVRIKSVRLHYSTSSWGFYIFLTIVEMIFKLSAEYFGYMVYKQASEGDSGYEQIRGGPGQSNPSDQQPKQSDAYVPASYSSPAPGHPVSGAPVVHSVTPPTTT